VACSTGVVDLGVWLRISCHHLRCALVLGRGIVFRRYYYSREKVLGRTFVMVQLCHWNGFGSLQLCGPFALRVFALLFTFQLVTDLVQLCHYNDFGSI
jgi:hypothetical protein